MTKYSLNIQDQDDQKHRDALVDGLNQLVKRVLFYTDGSTTRLLESLVGQIVRVHIHEQDLIEKQQLPAEIFSLFHDEGSFLYRTSSLYDGETVLSTNVVYSGIQKLSKSLQDDLYTRNIPLGKLISEAETRRDLLHCTDKVSSDLQPLYRHFTLSPGIYPVKQYSIIQQGICWFYVCELFHIENIVHRCTAQIVAQCSSKEGIQA